MINLAQGATLRIVDRCQAIGKPLDDQQRNLISAVIGEAMGLVWMSDDDIITMLNDGDLSEGQAAFWLGIDRLEVRRRANRSAADDSE